MPTDLKLKLFFFSEGYDELYSLEKQINDFMKEKNVIFVEKVNTVLWMWYRIGREDYEPLDFKVSKNN